MKVLVSLTLLITALQTYSQTGGSWSSIINTEIVVSQIEETDLLANRSGLHLVVKNTTTGIIYYRLNSNGAIQQSYNFQNSVGANFPRITGDHNNLYVLYQKDDSIKAFFNPNNGTNWYNGNNDIKSYKIPTTLINVSSLECAFDIYPENIRRVHITFTAKENNINRPWYSRYYTKPGHYNWGIQTDVNVEGIGTYPTVTVMPTANKTYFSFHNPENNKSYTRGFNSLDQHGNWDVASLATINSFAEKVYVDSPYLHLFFFDLNSNFLHRRSNHMPSNMAQSVTWGYTPNLLKQYAEQFKPKITKTADGYINIIYTASGLFYRRYTIVGENDTWSNEFTITESYVENPPCMSSVSNDIYVVWKDGIPLGGIKYLKLRKYDTAP